MTCEEEVDGCRGICSKLDPVWMSGWGWKWGGSGVEGPWGVVGVGLGALAPTGCGTGAGEMMRVDRLGGSTGALADPAGGAVGFFAWGGVSAQHGPVAEGLAGECEGGSHRMLRRYS